MPTRSGRTSTVYSSKPKKHKKEHTTLVKWMKIANCFITLTLFASSFERLEWLADKPLIDLHLYIPYSMLKTSILVDSYSQILVYIGLVFHLLAIKMSSVCFKLILK